MSNVDNLFSEHNMLDQISSDGIPPGRGKVSEYIYLYIFMMDIQYD